METWTDSSRVLLSWMHPIPFVGCAAVNLLSPVAMPFLSKDPDALQHAAGDRDPRGQILLSFFEEPAQLLDVKRCLERCQRAMELGPMLYPMEKI